jgi:long-chain-fatty-acid--CoA ligase ACSBG
LNVDKFKCINILGFNSPEWIIANAGATFAGCIAAGIYASNLPDACKYISEHSEAEVVVMEDNKQLEKYVDVSKDLKKLKALVVWMEEPDAALAKKCSCKVYSWKDFLASGSNVSNPQLATRTDAIRPGNCAGLIYTSGTTGPPKAVMISHDNLTWTTANMVENYMDLNASDRFLSYLPLSHIAAQILDQHIPILTGGCTYFAQPDALKGSIGATLKEVKPTIFFGVPRVWEKFQEVLVQAGRAPSSYFKKMLVNWAKSVAEEKNRRAQTGNGGGYPAYYGCMKSLVLGKIRAALGLEECKACFTAAAPIAPETIHFFARLDIPVYEVFGQSECTGPHTVSFENSWKIGTCGRPMKGTVSKIVPETGELIYSGRHIFMGYMHNPEKTAETIDDQGFLHSGDVSIFDDSNLEDVVKPSGFMSITGRIKELIITAGGENIPPVLIENEMKAAMPALGNCMVVGDKRKFLAMLVSLKTEVDKETGAPTDKLAADSLFFGKEIGSSATTLTEAAKDPIWKEYIDKGMKVANSKTTSRAQVVQKWQMLPVDFSEKGGELTPTLKLKRNVAAEKHAGLINSLYGDTNNV